MALKYSRLDFASDPENLILQYQPDLWIHGRIHLLADYFRKPALSATDTVILNNSVMVLIRDLW